MDGRLFFLSSIDTEKGTHITEQNSKLNPLIQIFKLDCSPRNVETEEPTGIILFC